MRKFKVRPASREDIDTFSDLKNKPTIRAYVGEVDGEIVGIGGLAFSHGRWFAFCDLKDEARKYKTAIARAAIKTMRDARDMGVRYIYAEADTKEPTALRWLASLGFERDPRTNYLFRWER